jgi:hypothetical protein
MIPLNMQSVEFNQSKQDALEEEVVVVEEEVEEAEVGQDEVVGGDKRNF